MFSYIFKNNSIKNGNFNVVFKKNYKLTIVWITEVSQYVLNIQKIGIIYRWNCTAKHCLKKKIVSEN